MKLEDQVCSLELAKRLKELGVKQESLFYWHPEDYAMRRRDIPPKWFLAESKSLHPHIRNAEACSAFTVAELGEIIKEKYQVLPSYDCVAKKYRWACYPCNDTKPIAKFWEETEADARAQMLIYLLENGLIPKGEPKNG